MDEDDKELSLRRKRRIEKTQRTKGARVRVLDPEHHYIRECDRVLRALAKWIAQRGFTPNVTTFAKHHTWPPEIVRDYLLDMLVAGDVELIAGRVFVLTRQGYARIGKVYMEPLLPPEMTVRARSLRDAKEIARKLKDPDIRAAFEAFHAEKVPHPRIEEA